MKKLWHHSAWEDYLFWQQTDKKVVKRINTLIKSCERTPFRGLVSRSHLKMNCLVIGHEGLIVPTGLSIK